MATVDRLTVTVPKELSARLKVVRDRMNVSRVCTTALEREVDMLEARPSVADPKIAQLVERLKGSSQRWYDRGHEGGMQWGVEKAKREDLERVAQDMTTLNSRGLVKRAGDLPASVEEGDRINRWVAHDAGLDSVPTILYYGVQSSTESAEEQAARDASARYQIGLEEVDRAAYLEGWRDALVELWDAIAPALH